MTTVVVGGHSRKVGKTSIAAGIIRAFRQYSWTAVKISTHWHEDPPADAVCSILEETESGDASDSSRFLAAGAARSFWVRIREGRFQDAMPLMRPVLQSGSFVLVESNAIVQFVRPDLYLMVLRYDVDEFKSSARATFGSVDAVIAVGAEAQSPLWLDLAGEKLASIPMFATPDPAILPPGFLEYAQSKCRLGLPP